MHNNWLFLKTSYELDEVLGSFSDSERSLLKEPIANLEFPCLIKFFTPTDTYVAYYLDNLVRDESYNLKIEDILDEYVFTGRITNPKELGTLLEELEIS